MRAVPRSGRWCRGQRDVSRSGIAPEALEVRAQVGSGLIAQRPILLEALVDDPFHLGWKVRIKAQDRTWCTVQDGLGNDTGTFAAERQKSSGHFIEHSAEGEEISASIEFLGSNLLGRHVGDC